VRPRQLATCAAVVVCTAATPAGAAAAPPTRYALPAGELRLSDSSVAAASAATIAFSVHLDRAVRSGRLALTLPKRWTQRSGVSGVAYAKLPARGRGSSTRTKVTRSGRVVSFAFARARSGDAGRFDVRDVGMPAGTYRLAYSWREGGRITARGTARFVFVARPRSR
jgi:hypothetical protein